MTELPKDPWDLRKVLREIKHNPADYHETDVEIDPDAEISGVYRYVGHDVQQPEGLSQHPGSDWPDGEPQA